MTELIPSFVCGLCVLVDCAQLSPLIAGCKLVDLDLSWCTFFESASALRHLMFALEPTAHQLHSLRIDGLTYAFDLTVLHCAYFRLSCVSLIC
jgi:hypothetical protein